MKMSAMRFVFLFYIGYCLLISDAWAHPQDPVDSLKQLLQKHTLDTHRVKILNQLSFRLSGNDILLSQKYAQEALEISLKLNYPKGISKSYNSLGICMRVAGDYPKALDYLYKALQIDETLHDDKETARTLSGIGAVYVKLKNYEKGIEYFEKSLKLRQKDKDMMGVAVCYTNLGDTYEKKGQYTLAIQYHEKALALEKNINPIGIHYSLHSLGNIYHHLQLFDKAIAYYQEALAIRKGLKNKYIIAETSLALGRVLIHENKFDEAYGYLDEGLALAKNSQAKELEEKAYLYFSEYYEKRQDAPKALLYQKKYIQLNDSLYNSEMTKQANLLQNRYQEEKMSNQEKENLWLKKNQEVQNLYYEKQRKISIFAIISGVVSLGLAVFLLIYSNKNYKINKLLEAKNQEVNLQHQQLSLQNHQIIEAQQQLEEVNEELQALNHHLEDLVAERTEKMKMSNEALQLAKDELDLFMYRISHDFRGPLATLIGLANVGKTEIIDDTALMFLDKTQRTAQKMGKMLDKLVMVNLVSHKQLEQKVIDFQKLVENILRKLQQPNHAVQIQINFSETNFVTDEEILEIIMFNLLENAFQFQRIEVDKHQVRVVLDKQKDFVKITVEDNGMGIEKEYQQKMFEMFFRASESSQGNGLGLYIVKKAVEKLNGEIAVESEVGNYTRFMIMLPTSSSIQPPQV